MVLQSVPSVDDPTWEVVLILPPRPSNDEVIIKQNHARDRPNTLWIIHIVYGMAEKGLCEGDSMEYLQGLLRRMHDKIRSTTTFQIA